MGGTGSGRLLAPGFYHFVIESAHDGKMPNGETDLKSSGFSATMRVLEGPQKDVTVGIILDDGEGHRDGGAFAQKKQTALFVAANTILVEQLGQSVEIDVDMVIGHQVCAEMQRQKDRDGNPTDFVDLKYANIYHVDDPRAAKCVKNDSELANIDSSYRHDASYFDSIAKPKPTSGGGDLDLSDL
jgi:hypothetical protein